MNQIPTLPAEPETGNLLPVLPLRDIVVFPGMVVPLFVGREKSINALEDVAKDDKKILLVTQRDATQDNPTVDDVFKIGVVASILQLLKLPDGTVKVLIEGHSRARIINFVNNEKFFMANAETLPEQEGTPQEMEALIRSVTSHFEQYIKLNKKIPPEVLSSLSQIKSPGKLADAVIAHLSIKISQKQELLEITNAAERLERIFGIIEGEIDVLNTEKKIRTRVKKQMEKTQREYYLNE